MGIVLFSWIVSKIPLGGFVFLAMLGVAAVSVVLGGFPARAPAFTIRLHRVALQHRAKVGGIFICLVCVGVTAIVLQQQAFAVAEEERRKREVAKIAAMEAARELEAEERANREAELEAVRKKREEDKAARQKLEQELFGYYFKFLWKPHGLPRTMNQLHTRVASRFNVPIEDAQTIYSRKQGQLMPDHKPERTSKIPKWAQNSSFAKKCGYAPIDYLQEITSETAIALEKKNRRPEHIIFDPNSCIPPAPHSKKCWRSVCVWRLKNRNGSIIMNKWVYYFKHGELKSHKVLFPKK